MSNFSKAFSTFSTHDMESTKSFYRDTLGLQVSEEYARMPTIKFDEGHTVTFYPKENHTPADYTILNFIVSDIEARVDQLVSKGVSMEIYDGFNQDEKGIARAEGRPAAAWFKDPAGNILCMLEMT